MSVEQIRLARGGPIQLLGQGMRLLRIAIKNFRVIRQTELVLPDQVLGIIGPNGAGKSSIVEAVAWALYGNRVARTSKEEIKSTYSSPDADCEVDLEFELGGEQYRINRKLIGRRGRTEVTLYRGSSCESVGTAETDRYIASLLGLEWRGFLTSFLARQQELNALADLAPGQRREHLAAMLGIGKLDSALKHVKEDKRVFAQTTASLEAQVAHGTGLRERLVELQEQARQLARQHDSLAGAFDSARQVVQKSEAAYREHQTKQAACSKVQIAWEANSSSRGHLEQQLEAFAARSTALEKSKLEMEQLAPDLDRLQPSKAKLAELEKIDLIRARRIDLQDQTRALNDQLSEIDPKLKRARLQVDRVAAELAGIPKSLPEDLKDAAGQLEAAQKIWVELRAEMTANSKATENLKKQIAETEQIGPDAVCDRCHRPFGDDLVSIKSHLADELVELLATGEPLAKNLNSSTETGLRLKSAMADLEKLVARQKELLLTRELSGREVADLTERQQVAIKRRTELTKSLEQIGSVEFDAATFERLKHEVSQLEQAQVRWLVLSGEVKEMAVVHQSMAKSREQLSATMAKLAELTEELTRIGFDEAAMKQAADQLAAQIRQLDEAKDAHLGISKTLELTQNEIKLKEEELGRLAETVARLENSRNDQFYAEKLASLFTEFRKQTISRIRPRLAELASQLIADMSSNRYSLVELDEEYNLQILDSGQYFGVDRFSGGEKDLASLCLRLAISLALTESAGLDRSFIILDEVFGSQDADRRDLIFQSLANLKDRFPQVILVTHLEELKHKVETLIELQPQPGGWSKVMVNGVET